MKKKLIATLVAGAVLSTGIIGLTACGGGLSINKGEEVSKEDWAKAFTATMEAKNFTAESYAEESMSMKGSGEMLKLMIGVESIDMSVKAVSQGKGYYDVENGTTYGTATAKVNVSGIPDDWKDEAKYQNSDVKTETYAVKDGDTVYNAMYNSASEEENKWSVYTTSSINTGLSYILGASFATEKGGASATVSTLYDAFTYGGGVYTADLWLEGAEVKVSVSVKGGYVVGFAYEGTATEEEAGLKSSESSKVVYNFSNYGSTTVNASSDAKKAVEDFKAQ